MPQDYTIVYASRAVLPSQVHFVIVMWLYRYALVRRLPEGALHPTFCDQGTGNVALVYTRATLKLLVIVQEFLSVQNACLGKLAVVERGPNEAA